MRWDSREQESVAYIRLMAACELERAGISLQIGEIDIGSKNYVITTDKKVPKEVVAEVCEYAFYRGIAVKFQTSETKSGGNRETAPLPLSELEVGICSVPSTG